MRSRLSEVRPGPMQSQIDGSPQTSLCVRPKRWYSPASLMSPPSLCFQPSDFGLLRKPWGVNISMEALARFGIELKALVLHDPDRRRVFSMVCRPLHPFFLLLLLPTFCLSRKLRRTASRPSLRRASSRTSSTEIVLRPACLGHYKST